MLNKKRKLSVLSTFLILNACSGGGGGVVAPVVVAKTPAQSLPPGFQTPIPTPTPLYSELVTDGYNPNPTVQVASYNKILRALVNNEFEYIIKEYDAGGLKITAVKAENDFADYPVNYAISSMANNTGLYGLRNKLVIEMSIAERKNFIDKILKHILIYGTRFSANRLMEFNRTSAGSLNPKYTTELARNASIYFYGNDTLTPSENSIAQLSQKIDVANASKTFEAISAGIAQLQKSASGDYTGSVNGRNMIEKGLLKMLYIATLEKAAVAIPAKNASGLDDAELYYLGIREQVKTIDNIKTTKIETLLGDRDFRGTDYPTLQKYLNLGFREKSINEMQNAIKNITINNSSAQNSAFNAQLYMDIINSSYENVKFKREENTILKENIINFVAAINSKNKELADISFQQIQKLSQGLI